MMIWDFGTGQKIWKLLIKNKFKKIYIHLFLKFSEQKDMCNFSFYQV